MKSPDRLWSVSLTVTPPLADTFTPALEENALALTVMSPPRSGKALIEAIYNEPPERQALEARLALIAFLHKTGSPDVQIKQMPGIDWVEKVAGDFPPLPIARWTTHGAHHHRAVANRRLALQIDATSAFGTGEHPTTRGCLLMLDQLLKKKRPGRMLDMGCGSAILAMAFAKTCHKKAIAVDLDPDSISIARNNLRVNGLQKYVRTGLSTGYRNRIVGRNAPYDLIMANIFARPLSRMAKDLKRHLKPGGTAILSGLLSHQANKVLAAHRMQRIYLVKRLRIGEWSVLLLK